MYISSVLLAAGLSSRMGGSNKLLLDYNNNSVIGEVVKQLSKSKVDEMLVVVGFESDKIKREIAPIISSNCNIIVNENYKKGRAESIKKAVENINEKSDAVLFMVGDKPTVTTSLFDKAIETFCIKQPDILFVETSNGRGHPIIFSSKLFNELKNLNGDVVGEEIIRKYETSTVTIFDKKQQIDIDTSDDYQKLLSAL